MKATILGALAATRLAALSLSCAVLIGACSGGASRDSAANTAAATARPDLTGIFATEVRYMDVGAPMVLRDTHWAPLSAGRPEDMKAQSFEEQSAAFQKLLDDDVDVFKWAAEHAFRPALTPAGQKAAAAAAAARSGNKVPRHPLEQCVPRNVVGLGGFGGAVQIMQSADRLLLVSESGVSRTVYLDGRGHEKSEPSWAGHSVGRWNGKTLEVETTRFAGETTVLEAPVPNSGAMTVREYFTLSDDGKTLSVKVVYEDPEMLVEPVARMVYLDRQASDYELLFSNCIENALGAAEYAATISKQ